MFDLEQFFIKTIELNFGKFNQDLLILINSHFKKIQFSHIIGRVF